jgi:signal transduction histidine kinase
MTESLKQFDILLVDDQPEGLLALEAILGELGQNLVKAHSGMDALREVLGRDFAVILLDLQMPEMDGYETAALIRERPASRHTPIIFLTAYDRTDVQMRRGYKLGAVDYLFKPLDADILRSKVAVFVDLAKKSALIQKQTETLIKHEAEVQRLAERAKMQEHLMISDRMISMGMLAAGVAHEINNPLACVMANLDLALQGLAKRTEERGLSAEFAEVRDDLLDACEATERIRKIVSDLKIFSRSKEDKTSPVDVQHVMESALRMALNAIRYFASLVKNYGETPLVQASESRLGQVFLNLIINAAQAIDERGAKNNEIRISTGMDPSGRNDVCGSVFIEIADTGSGMPPEVLQQIFTPFFTTKPIGVGTGLGLSICHQIVTGFGGSIDVKSEVGVGTTFRITLPLAKPEALVEAVNTDPDVSARRRGVILVVDDEPMITKAMQRIFSAEHEVVAAGGAKEALDRIGSGERFDVILCDLMMPQMTGMDLHAELSSVAQEQADRMVFLTGGAVTTRARDFLAQTDRPCIEKPFDAIRLRGMINDRINRILE